MDTSIIREQLHEYINTADEQHLAAIYVLLEKEMGKSYVYDEETLNMLYQRRQDHLNESSQSYTVDESMRMIREHKK